VGASAREVCGGATAASRRAARGQGTASTAVTVRSGAPTWLSLWPYGATVVVGDYQRFTATLSNICGDAFAPGAEATYTSSDPSVVYATTDGLGLGLAPGTVTFAVDARGLHAESTLTVTAP
jgi:hypothetical protein